MKTDRISVLAVLVVLLLASATFAGPSTQLAFGLYVQGVPGYDYQTGSAIEMWIGEGANTPFVYPVHSDNFTFAYWTDGDDKLSLITHSTPDANGDMVSQGIIEVGVNDTRTMQTFDWWVDNYQSPYAWFVAIYNRDTHRRLLGRLIQPEEGSVWGTINTRTSISGYDILVAAYNPNPTPVPEPSSFMALGAGCLGLAGLIRRKR